MAAMVKDCESIRKAVLKKDLNHRHNDSLGNSFALNEMLRMIPTRVVCDRLVRLYIDNFEHTSRILHFPTFLEDYKLFLAAQKDGSNVRADPLLPQMCLIMAIASSLYDPIAMDSENPENYFDTSKACGLVRHWLENLHGKNRMKLSTIRTQTLLLLAHQISLEPAEETWSESGALVRSAMNIGLHRDPAESPSLSVFESEQRKRLWMTIAEMDLQISMTCGMPCMIRGVNVDWCVPANVNDIDLFEGMTKLPPNRPSEEWTDSACQIILAKSLPSRLDTIATFNNSRIGSGYDQTLKNCKKIEEDVRQIPDILQIKCHKPSASDSDGPGRLLGRILLDVYRRRIPLSIYRQLALLGSHEARNACIHSSRIMLSHQDAFDPHVADLNIIKSERYWDLFYTFCKTDIVQAAISLCMEIMAMTQPSSSSNNEIGSSEGGETQNNQIIQVNPLETTSTSSKASLTRSIENTICSLASRIAKPGSDLKDPVCITIILQSIRTNNPTINKEELMRVGVVSIIKECRQRLQDDANIRDKLGSSVIM